MPTATLPPAPIPQIQTPFLSPDGTVERTWYRWLLSMDTLARALRGEVSDLLDPRSVLLVTDGVDAPTAEVGVAQIYVDTADGDLKVRFGDNHTAIVAADS